MLVIDEVLQVRKQYGEQGFACGNKSRRHAAREVTIGERRKAFADIFQVIAQTLCGFASVAAVIHWQVAQPCEVGKLLRFEFVERRAESRTGFEQVAEQIAQLKRLRRRLPFEFVGRNVRHQPGGEFNLLFDLRQQQRCKLSRIVHESSKNKVLSLNSIDIDIMTPAILPAKLTSSSGVDRLTATTDSL